VKLTPQHAQKAEWCHMVVHI